MSHITDYSKLPLDILLDLINYDHGTSLTTNHIHISAPTVVQDNRVSVIASSVVGSGYSGQQTLRYNRVPIAALTALEPVQTVVIADVFSYQEVVQKFNEKYGVNLTIDDVTIDGKDLTDVSYVQPEGPVVDLVIAAKPGSFIWHGQTTFKLRSTAMLLSDALPIVNLDGLWLPHVPEEPPPPIDPFADIPENRNIAVTDTGEVRVTDAGYVRVFAI